MKRYRVLWTHQAVTDLKEIVLHVASENTDAAKKILKKLKESAEKLKRQPERCRVVPELAEYGIGGIRELIWTPTPHRVMYRIDGSTVYILAVLDGRRDLEDLLFMRFMRLSTKKSG